MFFSFEWNQRLTHTALICLGLLCILILARMPFVLMADFRLAHHLEPIPTMEPADQHVEHLIQQIPNQHLFGNAKRESTALPITSMQLSLLGIVETNPKDQSHVIISEAGQSGKIYHINDRLPSGVTVNDILQDGVILENAGHLEKLPLMRHSLVFQIKPKPLLHEG